MPRVITSLGADQYGLYSDPDPSFLGNQDSDPDKNLKNGQ
jgi:hypothetical protein